MNELIIVTDGAADMPPEWIRDYRIHILPMPVWLGGKTIYLPSPDYPSDRFYRMIRELREVPHSSLPSMDHLTRFYESIAQKGDEILSIHVAQRMSGTFSVVQSVANELKDRFRIYPFDSGAGSAVLGMMCRQARRLAESGFSTEGIVSQLEKAKKSLAIVLTLENLDFARLSGRINAIQSMLSSVLRINPIIELREGLLQVAGRVRTRKKAVDQLVEMVAEKAKAQKMRFAVVHAADPLAAATIKERLEAVLNAADISICELALPVAANLGPGTVGIVAYPDDESTNDMIERDN